MTQEAQDLLFELEAYADLNLGIEARTIIRIWIKERQEEAEDVHNDTDLSGRI